MARGACGEVLVAVMIEDVAENKRGPRQPGNAPQRAHVRLHDEVAVALLPVGHGITRHRLHIDVVGEQIVAAVRLLISAVEEILGLKTLADEPALHVGEAGDHRVDFACADSLLQFLEGQHAGHEETSLSKVGRPVRKRAGLAEVQYRARCYTLTEPSRCFTANSSSGEKTSVFRP